MQYFITKIKGNKIIDKNLIHQIWKVLRGKVWDKLYLIDWKWKKDLIEIVRFSKKEIEFKIIRSQIEKIENWKIIRLFQVLPKSKSKWEFIIQKWTELWVSEFIGIKSQYSQAKYSIWSSREKLVAKEACEQSQRLFIPKIKNIEKYDDIFKNYSWTFYFFDSADTSLPTQFEIKDSKKGEINMIIWAEWGFTKEERQLAWKQSNCTLLSLWKNILRLETATMVALSRINY